MASEVGGRQSRGWGRDCSGSPEVKTSLSNGAGAGLTPGWGAKISHDLWPKETKA